MPICPICGKEFAWTRKQPRKCCSFQCAGKARKGIPHPKRRRPQNLVTLACVQCGKTFTVHKAQNTGTRHRRFCSLKCMGEWRKGEHNPAYIDGSWAKKKNKHRGPSWHKQRRAALIRDGKQCQICGKKQKPGEKAVVDVHHIIRYQLFNGDHEKANDLSNLITLCKLCHNKVERQGYPCPQPLL